ncbi:hypothetical protein BJV74DRAFT_124838 [Russula compacta]|nr:hypothetical protein BJV74DRAFT_124838 [Russula compacta]
MTATSCCFRFCFRLWLTGVDAWPPVNLVILPIIDRINTVHTIHRPSIIKQVRSNPSIPSLIPTSTHANSPVSPRLPRFPCVCSSFLFSFSAYLLFPGVVVYELLVIGVSLASARLVTRV